MEAQEIVISLIDKMLTNSKQSHKAEVGKCAKLLLPIFKEFPYILWDSIKLVDATRALMMAYHSDVFDDEDDTILLTHLGFLYICRAEELLRRSEVPNKKQLIFDALRTKVLLLNTCEDSFVFTISSFYNSDRDTSRGDEKQITAMQLSQTVLPLVQYHVILQIDDLLGNLNDDEILEGICNDIELEHEDISDKLMQEASNVNTLLLKHISKQVSNKNYQF